MKCLKTGCYLGAAKRILNLNGLIISDIEYKKKTFFPWHYHENPYFAFVLSGSYNEVNKNGKIVCLPGSVIFHPIFEKHFNDNFTQYSRILNLEIGYSWLTAHNIKPASLESQIFRSNPNIQSNLSKLHIELMNPDFASNLTIEEKVIDIIASILPVKNYKSFPVWVKKIKDILNDENIENITLKNLSEYTGVHPVHISRDFQKYYNCSFRDYMRINKVEKSIILLHENNFSLTEIAYQCGFSDQSHYTRTFRKYKGITPSKYRRLIFKN